MARATIPPTKTLRRGSSPAVPRPTGIGYIRVSSVRGREGDSYQSPKIQRERIEAMATYKGIRIVGWYTDENFSGKNTDRPGFQQAMADVMDGRADYMLVARLSRFGRSVADTHRELERLEGRKLDGQLRPAALLSDDLNIDMKTKEGRMVRGILTVLAQFELEAIEENWTAVLENAIARGTYVAQAAPTGYRFAEVDDCPGPDPDNPIVRHQLLLDADEIVQAVRALFLGRAAGKSWRVLRDEYEAATGRRLGARTVEGIIENRAYVGESAYRRQEGDDLVNPGAHDAIVTEDEWQAAQRKRVHAPRPSHPNGNARDAALLAGLLRCHSCGFALTREGAPGSTRAKYKCSREHAGGRCQHPVSIGCNRMDAFVWDLVAPVIRKRGQLAAKGTRRSSDDQAAVIRARIEKRNAAHYRWQDAIEDMDDYPQDEIRRREVAWMEKNAADEAALEDLLRDAGVTPELVRLADIVDDPGCPVDDRRRVVAALLQPITVHPSVSRAPNAPVAGRVSYAPTAAAAGAIRASGPAA